MSFFCFWQKENLKTVMSQFCDDILGIVVAFCETEAFIFDYKFEINSYVVTILTNCGFSENRFIMKPISSFRHFQMLSPQTSLNGDVYAISAGKETHYCIYKFRKEQQFGSFSQTLKFTDLFHPMEFTELFQPIQSFSIYNLEGNSKLFEHCGNVYIYSPNLYSDIIKFFSTNINVDDGNNVRNCTLKKKTHALKYLILIYKTLPVININALNVVRRTLVSCNECLYFTGLEPNLNILIISQLIFDLEKQIVNTEQTFIYQQNPDEKKLLIQVVHPRAKKILYLSENFLCVFDCVKQKWKTPKMHKNKLNIYGYGEQKHQDDLAIIAPLDDNVIYFPFWSCKCKQQPSKCNYYDISLRMWVLCCSMMLSDSPIVNTHDQFLLLNK